MMKKYLQYSLYIFVPMLLAYLLSEWLGQEQAAAIADRAVVIEEKTEPQSTEKALRQIFEQHKVPIDAPLDEVLDNVLQEWVNSPESAQDIDQMYQEIRQVFQKDPTMQQKTIEPIIKDGEFPEDQLLAIKLQNNHPLDTSLEDCLQQYPENPGGCFAAHVGLWEDELKRNFDAFYAKLPKDLRAKFKKNQANWQERLLEEQQLNEEFQLRGKDKAEQYQVRLQLLIQILQKVKNRALELQQLLEESE